MIHLASEKTNSALSTFTDDQVQPNAIDLRIDKLFKIANSQFVISEDGKTHRGSVEMPTDKGGFWSLYPGTYEIIMEGTVKLAEDEAGWVITRSTLNRNGAFITSGLYDSGYEGVMAGVLHVSCGQMKIAKGTRVGQFLLFKSEALHAYDGSYGVGKEHDQKYGVS
jgi:deoxycytidine triphosphate deaminase